MAHEFLRLVSRGATFQRQPKHQSNLVAAAAAQAAPIAVSHEQRVKARQAASFFDNGDNEEEKVEEEEEEKEEKEARLRKNHTTHKKNMKKKNIKVNEMTKEERKQLKQKLLKESARLRKLHGIKVQGTDIPDLLTSFDPSSSAIPRYLLNNLTRSVEDGGLGYDSPTPIQMQAIPTMAARREILGIAPTGSGKTVAFLLPLLMLLDAPAKKGFRGVIVCPTRELAEQIFRHAVKLAQGKSWRIHLLSKANANMATLGPESSKRKDILICTPLRLVNALRDRVIDVSAVEALVMDEADRLLQMGFAEQIDEILAALPSKKSIFMFSATLYQGVEVKARSVLRDPVQVQVGGRNAAAHTVDQKLVFVGSEHGKLVAMRQMAVAGFAPPVLVFVQSKERGRQLFQELVYENINVEVIHSDRTAAQRSSIMKRFRSGEIWVLICTDLMSRGVDFKGVNQVINYDLPQSTVSYIHRIGRTGRAGRKGSAVTFFTENDVELVRGIAGVMDASGCHVPDWILKLKTPSLKRKREVVAMAPARQQVTTKIRASAAAKKQYGLQDDKPAQEKRVRRKKKHQKKLEQEEKKQQK